MRPDLTKKVEEELLLNKNNVQTDSSEVISDLLNKSDCRVETAIIFSLEWYLVI